MKVPRGQWQRGWSQRLNKLKHPHDNGIKLIVLTNSNLVLSVRFNSSASLIIVELCNPCWGKPWIALLHPILKVYPTMVILFDFCPPKFCNVKAVPARYKPLKIAFLLLCDIHLLKKWVALVFFEIYGISLSSLIFLKVL